MRIRLRLACRRPIELLAMDPFEAGQQLDIEEVAKGKRDLTLAMTIHIVFLQGHLGPMQQEPFEHGCDFRRRDGFQLGINTYRPFLHMPIHHHPAPPIAEVVWSKNSCGFARVVFQEPAEPFTTLHRALTRRVLADDRKEQHVVFALVIPLMMKMLDILRQHMAERGFPKQDELRQAFLLHRSDPPLRISIQIWRPWWQWYTLHPGGINDVLKGRTVFSIPVVDEILSG